MKKGDSLSTPFGQGVVLFYRQTDGIYVVQLPFATLYANAKSITPHQKQQQEEESCADETQIQAMELNVAYEALDKMRKLNLQVECQQRGIPCIDSQCTTCLLLSNKHRKRHFPRIQKLVYENTTKITTSACLSCGSPVCHSHSSRSFKKESIAVCTSCEKLFTLDFVVECMTAATPQVRKQRIVNLVDVYDRILLLLKYSEQIIPQVSLQLQESTVVQNKVGIGSSSAGIVSGVLGVAAAATILTPAGPPLLIASLLFGGSATAVQTGADVKNYYSDSNRLADRVLALHGMLQSILKVTSTLRDALLRDYLRTDGVDETILKQQQHDALDTHKGTLLAGLTVSRAGAAGVELGALATAAEVGAASRNARFFTRGGTGIMRTARFARFAGGALSAATLVFETKCMSDTIQNIRAGNPCEKAELLQVIQSELHDLPTTSSLERELQNYLEGLAQRKRRMTEEECVRLILDASHLQDYKEEEDETIVFVDSNDDTATTAQSDDTRSVASSCSTGGASLLERIERFKQKDVDDYESNPNQASLIERISMYKSKRESSSGRVDDSAVPVATLG